MSGKLSDSQRRMLTEAARHGSTTAYRSDTVTVLALERKGFVTWSRHGGSKYGLGSNCARVSITPAGRACLENADGH